MEIRINDDLALTEVRSSDKPAFLEHLADRAIYERTLRIPFPYTASDADQWISKVSAANAGELGPSEFALRLSNGLLIGCIGFAGIIPEHAAEIGYWLARPWWGGGLMTTAVGRACDYAFERWRLVRITAHVFAFNAASARVLEKNGFEFEGLLRKHARKDGQFLDCRLLARVR